jgi:integration host factor subunit beta
MLFLHLKMVKVDDRFEHRESQLVTKKEIVKQISEKLGLTQLKTKDIVQKTFDAIVETLLTERRIELRNFGVFEVKRRKPRKARNPRTGERVDVEAKNVVTFKPGKEMEERVRQLDLGPAPKEPALAGVGSEGSSMDDANGKLAKAGKK